MVTGWGILSFSISRSVALFLSASCVGKDMQTKCSYYILERHSKGEMCSEDGLLSRNTLPQATCAVTSGLCTVRRSQHAAQSVRLRAPPSGSCVSIRAGTNLPPHRGWCCVAHTASTSASDRLTCGVICAATARRSPTSVATAHTPASIQETFEATFEISTRATRQRRPSLPAGPR